MWRGGVGIIIPARYFLLPLEDGQRYLEVVVRDEHAE